MSKVLNGLQEIPKNTLLRTCLWAMFLSYIIASLAFCIKADNRILDAFLATLLASAVALTIGNSLRHAGSKKIIAFGEVAGHYVSTLGILTPCLTYLAALCAYTFCGTPLVLESAPRWSVVFLLAVLLIVALAIIEKLYRSERSHVAAEAQLKSQLAKANKRAHDLEPHLIAWNKTQSELDAQDVRGSDVIDQYKKNLAESRKEIRVGGTKNGQLRKKKPS
jgi:hypothetical protein